MYPIHMMPSILQEFSTVNPMSYVVDATRALMISGDLSNLPLDLVAIAIFDVVMFIAASAVFKRIIE